MRFATVNARATRCKLIFDAFCDRSRACHVPKPPVAIVKVEELLCSLFPLHFSFFKAETLLFLIPLRRSAAETEEGV